MPSVIHSLNTLRDCKGYDKELEGYAGFSHELVSRSQNMRG